MSLLRNWNTNLLLTGLGLFVVCPIVSAQSVFDEDEAVATQPKAQWRQRVVQNNNASQNITRDANPSRDTNQNTSNIRNPRWMPYRQSNQDTDYRTVQQSSYQQPNQDNKDSYREVEQRAVPKASNTRINRARPSGVYSTAYNQPKNIRVAQREMPAEMEAVPAPTQYEPLATEGAFAPQDEGGSCGSDCGDCSDCEECSDCDCAWLAPGGGWGPRNLAVFGGVHGYKGPRDRGVNGNFGFTEGVNFGAPLGDPWGCGFQVGFAALQSNISGYNNTTTTATTADRHQYFFTTGVFRRAECAGWQWGVGHAVRHLYPKFHVKTNSH
jgi:hypothetical protein